MSKTKRKTHNRPKETHVAHVSMAQMLGRLVRSAPKAAPVPRDTEEGLLRKADAEAKRERKKQLRVKSLA